jgi:hypothetical protein
VILEALVRALVLAVPLIALGTACSATRSPAGFVDDSGVGSSGGSSGGGSSGSSGSLLGDAGAVDNGAGCSDAAKLVYVVSDQNDLYSFHPDTLTFTNIGTMNCPAAPTAEPNSMAVDRNGVAWVNFNDGTLFKVSTADASCTSTSFVPQQGFQTFGMGFSTNAPGTTAETLFVCGFHFVNGIDQGLGLARLDTTSLAIAPLGTFTCGLHGECGELTGTGDAKLYGFFEGSPAMLADIDKSTTATPSPHPLGSLQLSTDSAYAFSFWGGDFWFYSANAANMSSQVTRYKAATDGSVSVVMPSVGFTIVGAGVSTCAPTTPTK